MAQERNVCAGPFGAIYDFYIEHHLLARVILGAMWGVDPRPFYRSLHAIAELPDARPSSTSPAAVGPGGRLLGSTFLSQGSHRQRLLLRNEDFGSMGSAEDLRNWLRC